ncbi:hypothetical protein GGR57DRAFT_507329 [Xylariaceae sp. FL1272]|nr:hypothetical protein GGR57DRAFT_507329 [Xylariaceae sp. FL1272]
MAAAPENDNRYGADLGVTVNKSFGGAKFPEVKLPDGSSVQTGTFGSLLINIRGYAAAAAKGDPVEIKEKEDALRLSIPMLDKLGFFELFPPEDWEHGDHEGKKATGRLIREYKALNKDSQPLVENRKATPVSAAS